MNTPIFEDDRLKPDDPARGYKVPEGYFDQLHQSIMQRIEDEEQQMSAALKQRTKLDILKPYLYLAAMFVGLTLIINVIPSVREWAQNRSERAMMADADQDRAEDEYQRSPWMVASQEYDLETVEIPSDEYQQLMWEELADEFIVASISENE